MVKKSTGIFSLTLLVFLTGAGIVAPIAWDWWNTSSALTLTYVQETVLVEKKANVDELEISYKGHRVENLSKVVFRLENTGRLPIVETDLIDPPVLTLIDGVVLKTDIEDTTPPNLQPTIEIVDNTVRLSFRLLNANDSITFSVLTDSIRPNYSANARIKNVSGINVVRGEDRISLTKDIGWTVYVVGVFSLIFVAVGIGLFAEVPKEKEQLHSLREGKSPIQAGISIEIIDEYIKSDLDFLSGERKETVNNAIPNGTDTLDETQVAKLISIIERQINKEPSFSSAVIVSVIAAIGIWYIIDNVLINGS
jgi:hypothetical protein